MQDSAPVIPIHNNTFAPPDSSIPKAFWFFAGMVIGAAPPLLLSIYHIQQFEDYTASLPPDAVVCGMPMMVPFMLIFFVTPITALFGGYQALIPVMIIEFIRLSLAFCLHRCSL